MRSERWFTEQTLVGPAALTRKERDLAFYVGQLQGKVQAPDDSDWWQKQLGSKPAA